MGPMQLSDEIESWRRQVDEQLEAADHTPVAYARAAGELKALALWMAIEIAKLDPCFDLTVDDAELDAFDAALGEGRR